MDLLNTISGATGSLLLTLLSFLAGADGRRFRPRVRPFLGRPPLRGGRKGLFDRVRTGTARVERPPRHPLEDLGDSARRLREVRRRRECGERARTASLGQMPRHERAVSFPHKSVAKRAAIVAAGPIANFLLAIAIFAGAQLRQRPAGPRAPRRAVQAGQRCRAGGLPAERPHRLDQRPRRSTASRTCSARQRERRRDPGPSWSSGRRGPRRFRPFRTSRSRPRRSASSASGCSACRRRATRTT